MTSSAQGGAALGLQIAGLGAGIAASAASTKQGGMDKRISGGEEDPALAALRKRLAAQNAQNAMRVAASQQGVNPALAQRNAQQALGQAQVQSNANLAQHNANSTLQSRGATRGQQTQALNGTLAAVGGGLNAFGTSLGTDAAAQAAMGGGQTKAGDAANYAAIEAKRNQGVGSIDQGLTGPAGAPGQLTQEGAAGLGSPLAAQGAAGLAAPPQGAPIDPMRAFPQQLQGGGGLAAPPNAAPAYVAPQAPQAAPGQMQMQGNTAQVTGQGLGQVSPARSTMPNQPMGPAPVTEAPLMGQGAPAQAAPTPVAHQNAPVQPSPREQIEMLSPEQLAEPVTQANVEVAHYYETQGQYEIADQIRRRLLQDLGR